MHVDYVHANPVKHGLAHRPKDWKWSTFRKFVQAGFYDENWCGRVDLPEQVEYFLPD